MLGGLEKTAELKKKENGERRKWDGRTRLECRDAGAQ